MKLLTPRLFAVCLLGITHFAVAALARADDSDPPTRVARLSFVRGEVAFAPEGSDTWIEATLNRPLTNGDQLWAPANSRAELQLGSATVQADENTSLSFLELSDDMTQLRLTEGTVNLWVRRLTGNDAIEIDTPNAAVSLLEPGVYRVDLGSDNRTTVRVRDGRVAVNGDRQSFTLESREQAQFRGTGRLTAEFSDVDPQDEFDRWAAARNERAERVAATRYVADDVIGYEDLEDYGSWHSDAEFGEVWIPTSVAVGWAPYRYGHWVWVAPWGWTWVDDAPWGFAPFHYGRWAFRASRWCWVPGPRQIRPVYAPALVAWVGSPGINVSISIGPNAVGWLPLGPREVYVPGYRSSRGYVRNINISNARLPNPSYVDNFIDHRGSEIPYVNRAVPGAFSVVEQSAFIRGRPVNNHLVRVDGRALQATPIEARPPQLRPERDSALGSGRRIAPPPIATDRAVIAIREPRRTLQPPASGQFTTRPDRTVGPPVKVVQPPISRPAVRERTAPPGDVRRPEFDSRNRELRDSRRDAPLPGNSPARPETRRDLPIAPAAPAQNAPAWSNRAAPETPREARQNPPQESSERRFNPRPGNVAPPPRVEAKPREERSSASPWVQQENRLRQAPHAAIQSAPKERTPTNAPAGRDPPEQKRRVPDKDENQR